MDDSKPAKTRRGNREGTEPYELPDGRWRSELTVGVRPDGRPRKKIIYGATRPECRAKLHTEMAKLQQDVVTEGGAIRFIDWIHHYLDNIAASKVRPRTLAGYRSYIRNYVEGTSPARVRLDKVQPEHLEYLYARMRLDGRAEATVAQLHRILARALRVAVQRRRIAVSPATRMDAPQPGESRVGKALDPDQARALVAAARSRPDGARWMVALALGLRQGEALALGWDDIDLAGGSMKVRREVYRMPWSHGCAPGDDPACGRKRGDRCPERTGGGIFTGPPKSRAGTRSIAVPGPLVEALREHRRRQLAERKAFEADGGEWGFVSANGEAVDLVFPRAGGRAADSRSDWGAWQAFLADAGLPGMRVHDARHTAATVLLLLGVAPRVVMEIMGWSQISMVLRYQHVLDSMKIEAADKVGAALWSAPEAPAPGPPAGNVVSLAERRARRA